MYKIQVYKLNDSYFLVLAIDEWHDGIKYEINKIKYGVTIELFKMKNVASVFDECYESHF